ILTISSEEQFNRYLSSFGKFDKEMFTINFEYLDKNDFREKLFHNLPFSIIYTHSIINDLKYINELLISYANKYSLGPLIMLAIINHGNMEYINIIQDKIDKDFNILTYLSIEIKPEVIKWF